MSLLMNLVELMRKGLPPVAGGSLDQAHQFTEAAQFIWSESDFWRSKLDPFRRLTHG